MSDGGQILETSRLAALRRLDILDTPPEPGFDDVVMIARLIAQTPVALISLIDEDRQWFKARVGLEVCETPRSVAFCDIAIRGSGVLIVPDATRDPRFAENPLVTGDPFIRFYAGAPIRVGGHAIGTVCVIGLEPRTDFVAAEGLAALARQAATQIEMRAQARHGDATRDAAARDFDRLWTLAHDLLMLCDLEGGVLVANPAWEDAFGAAGAPGSVQMRQFLIDEAERPDLRQIEDGRAVTLVRDYRGIDGDVRTIAWTLRREGEIIYAIGRDDTALRTAERELVQAQKMESLGQLTGGIAHDFNNLLTIITGNLDIARRRLGTGDMVRVQRAITDAGEGASRAAILTQRLLAFARRQRLAPRAAAPATLLGDMRTLIERAASDTIRVDIVVEQGIWPIEIDVNQLENAILNLAVNARDAMSGIDDAALVISASNELLEPPDAKRHEAAPGDYVRISIADTGMGMTGEVRARAFEPFFTTKGVGRGTGLGLSQVEGFMRQSGGFVTIDTEPHRGTIVHLWLPRGHNVPMDIVTPMPPAQPAPRSACVMVVEDNDALRELVVETLRDAGYRVLEAHDGRSALSLFARQSIPPALVVSDVMMPMVDGFALAAEIRERSPATRVLLMSGYAGVGAVAGVGDDVLLLKPFTSDALLDRVRATLEA